MVKIDEDALICDLAETYHIYDYKRFPLSTVAVFSCGLRENSRIKLKMNNQLVSLEAMLLASISDRLGILTWFQSEDGQKGKNRPTAITPTLTRTQENPKETVAFESGEAFEKTRLRLLGGGS